MGYEGASVLAQTNHKRHADFKKSLQMNIAAVAKEKNLYRWRMMMVAGVGIIVAVGLAASSFLLSGAALSHSIYLGGLVLTVMITTLKYNDHQHTKTLKRLDYHRKLLIQQEKKMVASASVGNKLSPVVVTAKNHSSSAPAAKLSQDDDTFLAALEEQLRRVDGINIPLQDG